MKRVIISSVNTSNIAAKPAIEAAENDEAVASFEEKMKSVETDFDFLMSAIEQLDLVPANEFINDIHADIRGFIDDVTNSISE